jgi:hypothetical protein
MTLHALRVHPQVGAQVASSAASAVEPPLRNMPMSTAAAAVLICARANMHAVEVTIQNLISSGMDPKTENNPYLGFVYTSFQERATKVGVGLCNSLRLLMWV